MAISSLLEAQTFIFSSVYIAFKSIGLKFSSYLTRWLDQYWSKNLIVFYGMVRVAVISVLKKLRYHGI
jgi:hypothetical protein